MVDPGEVITTTLKREFAEEALNALSVSNEQKSKIQQAIDIVFKNGVEVSKISDKQTYSKRIL